MISSEIIDGVTYYSAEARGVQYTLCQWRDGEWQLYSKRKSLGRMSPGTVRFFGSLEDVEKTCKAFHGIAQLAAVRAGRG